MSDNTLFLHQRGRHADIIREALDTYDEWMKDDDYNATTVLHNIMKRMQERLDMSAIPPSNKDVGGAR